MHDPAELPALRAKLAAVLEQAPIEFSLLFGSAGRAEPFRDLDVAVKFRERAGGLRPLLDWGGRLEQAVGVPVDLVSLDGATVAFQFEVSRGEALTTQNADAFYEWRERTWNSYFEIQHFLNSHAREYAAARSNPQE